VLRTKDERRVTLVGGELSTERLAHGYAVTAHRSQGQTVERAHVYTDGGGRELAYVAMSRAKESSHAYLVADNLDQATEDLVREWSSERRTAWVTDLVCERPSRTVEAVAGRPEAEKAREAALSHARLSATYLARTAAVPKDPGLEIAAANGRRRELRELRRDLRRGQGVWANTEAGRATRDLMEARREMRRAASMAEQARWRDRRSYRKQVAAWAEREAEALGRWTSSGAPEAHNLDGLIAEGENTVRELGKGRDCQLRAGDGLYQDGTKSRLGDLQRDISALRDRLDGIEPPSVARHHAERSVLRVPGGLGHDDGLDYDQYRGIGGGLGR
jgi:hypothetical protein